MKKSEFEFVNAIAKIKNRVAVKKYYYEELPQDVKSLAFTVSNLETLRQVEMVKRSLDNAIEKGESFKSWRDNLDTSVIHSLSNARLETVYRTNVNTVYNQSTRFNAFTSDVTPYLMYDAVGDERTRPEHMKLDGVIKRADSKFWDKYTAPIGFNCTASFQKVSGHFTKGFRSFYNGDMVRINLKSGKVIRGLTLNHPVMTSEGFILAKNLYVGDKLASNNTEVGIFGHLAGKVYNDQLNASASDAFKSCVVNAMSVTKSSAFNFNGDIEFMNEDVDVVLVDSELVRTSSKGIFKNLKKFFFKSSDNILYKTILSRLGKCLSSSHRNVLFIKNILNMRRGHVQLFSNPCGPIIQLGVEALGFAFDKINILSEKTLLIPVSRFDSQRIKSSDNRVSTDSELLRKFENASSLVEGFDEIVEINFYPYFGFVYDFESAHGMVITDGVLTSNCRCGVIPLSKEEAEARGISTRSNDSFPEPEDMFGSSKMGDITTQVSKQTEKAIESMPNSALKSKFIEAQDNVRTLVDIWWQKEKDIFNQE